MKLGYAGSMGTEIVQVRDVPTEDVTVLRQRAAARGVSLSAYLREVIHEETSRPTMSEVVARVSSRESVEMEADIIQSAIDDDHR